MIRPPDVVHIAITLADDTLAVMAFITREYAADGSVTWSRQATKEAVDAEVALCSFTADKMPVKGWRPTDPRDVPADRTYRDALRDTGTTIEHDMEHVKRLALDHVRQERAPLFAELDALWMRANGQGDAKAMAEIEAKRQTLRDAPQTMTKALEAVKTVDDVKAARPDVAALATLVIAVKG